MRSYYHQHRKEVIAVIISVLIGASIMGLNTWEYQSSTDLHQFSSVNTDPQILTLRLNNPVELTFPLRNPEKLSNVRIDIVFAEVNPRTTFTVHLNGEQLQTDISDLSSGSTVTLHPESDILQRRNVIRISSGFERGASARLQSISITGFESTRRIIYLVLNFLGLLIAIGPVLTIKYLQYRERVEIEDRFPDFLRDVVEGTRSGMSLPQAIENARENGYGRLSKHVKQMSAKLDWGIPFETILNDFADKSRSKIVKRAVTTIIQTYDSGGNVSNVLETVGNNLKEIKKLRRQRESELYGEMVTGYIVYFIFLVVLIGLIKYLLPALSFSANIEALTGGSIGGQSAQSLINRFRPLFRNLIVIQSIFSGLVIGKLSEGRLKAGGKHVAILLSVGYLAAIIFM